MQTSHKLWSILVATVLAGPMPANAAEHAPPRAVQQIAQNDGLSLSEAVERVRRQYNGRIVSAETIRRGNREVHQIKVLTDDGKVKTVRIPGRTINPRG